MPATATRDALRRCFARFGLPRQVRVDNGTPWRSKGDLPTDLELWLVGLGVALVANPPRRPQDNGVVERSQGTAKRWGEPGTAASAAELQGRLDRMDRLQREAYPYREGLSRWATYPGLAHSGRGYDPAGEAGMLDEHRSRRRLAGFVVPRRVDGGGSVSVWGRTHYVGKAYAGRVAYVRFDPQDGLWLFQDESGHQWHRREARELTAANLLNLSVTNQRDRTPADPPDPSQLDVATTVT